MFNLAFHFLFFCLCYLAYGILVSRPGIEPVPPAVKAWTLNHWTAREALWPLSLYENKFCVWCETGTHFHFFLILIHSEVPQHHLWKITSSLQWPAMPSHIYVSYNVIYQIFINVWVFLGFLLFSFLSTVSKCLAKACCRLSVDTIHKRFCHKYLILSNNFPASI